MLKSKIPVFKSKSWSVQQVSKCYPKGFTLVDRQVKESPLSLGADFWRDFAMPRKSESTQPLSAVDLDTSIYTKRKSSVETVLRGELYHISYTDLKIKFPIDK